MEFSEEDYEYITSSRKKKLNDGLEMEKLFKTLAKITAPKSDKKCYFKKGSKGKKVHFSGRLSNNYSQSCIVKMTYGTTKEAHKNFFRSYMVQENKNEVTEKPKYFDAEYDEVPESELKKYESEMTDLYFKFILSPESKNVPLKELARSFIKNLQLQTGYSFSWKAVIHCNTEHPHCHILINGKDSKTRRMIKRISPRIIRNAHLSAEQICTNLVGAVTSEELELRKEKSITASRWTKFDEKILQVSTTTHFTSNNGTVYSGVITPSEVSIEKRLKTLVDIGIAIAVHQNDSIIYYLEKDWDKKLRSIGRYNSFLTARSNLLYSAPGVLEQYSPELGRIHGYVSKIFIMDDETVWNNAIVVENKITKKAYYVPLKNPPSRNLIHQLITVECIRNQNGKLSPKIQVIGKSKNTFNKSDESTYILK